MNRTRLVVVLCALLALLARSAAAQPAGALTGYVYDPMGMPVRGVNVKATCPALENGRAAYTNDEGHFRLGDLPPGECTVVVSAPKARTIRQEGVKVGPGETGELAFILELGSPTEEVRLVVPRLKMSVSSVKEVYDVDFVGSSPLVPFESNERYDGITESPFLKTPEHPASTFAIDVDTASYSNARRFLDEGALPPAEALRTEELINYFPYDYPPPVAGAPFGVSFEAGDCPWNPEARLLRIGLRGRDVPPQRRPPANLVFLIDVSGSMDDPRKLPLVQQSLRLLVAELRPQDRVALVVYAGKSGLVLPSTPASERQAILAAIDRLEAGGSTNGGEGIELAYATARAAFLKGGNNRVILATDGDFNVGVTDREQLVRLIEAQAKRGVFLTVLGFGMGNLKDATLEKLADRGDGNYAYIDSLREARRVLVEETGTLLTIAKDVKVQVQMNPARVGSYRLIGYENRAMPREHFDDDRKDGGEIGAGHTVTALYEIVPATPTAGTAAGPLATVSLRYKEPQGTQSRKLDFPLQGRGDQPADSADLRFAAAVAAFGLVLRESPHRGNADLAMVERLGRGALGPDPGGHRRGFLELVSRARALVEAGVIVGAQHRGLLTISQDGRRDVTLVVADGRIDGKVRGAPVHVQVKPREIVGEMGGEPLWLHTREHEAAGHIGGTDVGFSIVKTPTGHLVTGTSLGHTVRIEESHGLLSWLPWCEEPLVRLPRAPGASAIVYQGTCAGGRRMRLTVPDELYDLLPLPRLLLLGLLLTEQDPAYVAQTRTLFPQEETP